MKIQKTDNNEWMVWNEDKLATIVKIEDETYFGHNFYRVDGSEGTVATLIDNFQTAKKKANQYLKNNL